MSTVLSESGQPSRAARRSRSASARCHIDQILRHHDPSGIRWNYWRLINALQSSSNLLTASANRNRGRQIKRIALACARLSRCNRDWSRAPETWQSESSSDYVQWCSFVDHVLHQYPTPSFFAKTWLLPNQAKWQRELHRHLSKGQSIRNFRIPEFGRIGKQHAKWFMLAPDDTTVDGAIRWAQVRAAGGEANLARWVMNRIAVNGSTPGWNETWANVIDFLIRNQPISESETYAILRFVYEQRFQSARETVGYWMADAPLQRQISVRRWSLRRMRRWMANWREDLQRPKMEVAADHAWAPTNFSAMRETIDGRVWQIVELCTRGELHVEGGILQHCVGGYYTHCERGNSSIWSLRRFEGDQMKRVATIEVDPRCNRLVQAKAKRNDCPSRLAMNLIHQWARREGIKLS